MDWKNGLKTSPYRSCLAVGSASAFFAGSILSFAVFCVAKAGSYGNTLGDLAHQRFGLDRSGLLPYSMFLRTNPVPSLAGPDFSNSISYALGTAGAMDLRFDWD